MKNLAETACVAKAPDGSGSGQWFAGLLWRAFPAHSENEVAEKAGRALGVSARQVKNWLRCENSPAWKYVSGVLLICGAEIVFQRIEGRR